MMSTRSLSACVLCVLFLALNAPVCAAEEKTAEYGRAEVVEIGFQGGVWYVTDALAQNFRAMGSVFCNYFLLDGFHIGGKLDLNYSLIYDPTGALADANGLIMAMINPGYLWMLSPFFGIDFTLCGGIALANVWFSHWNLLFIPVACAQIMFQFPIFENAVLGIGYYCLLQFFVEQGIVINSSGTYYFGSLGGISLSNMIILQLSFWF